MASFVALVGVYQHLQRTPRRQRQQGIHAALAAEALSTVLRESAAELERVISLRTPTVDDGIVTNTAPLFRLRPHWDSRARRMRHGRNTATMISDGR